MWFSRGGRHQQSADPRRRAPRCRRAERAASLDSCV